MNDCVETLNRWGENFLGFAGPMLWQSSVLIAVVFAFDRAFARRIRASIRYALWMIVLVKLIVPPSLALPTGAAWWLWRTHPVVKPPVIQNFNVSFGDAVPDAVMPPTVPVVLPPPKLNGDAWVSLAAVAIGAGLFAWLGFRWLRIAGKVRRAKAAPAELDGILDEAWQLAGLRRRPQLKLVDGAQSPAVCGLFRPAILLPRTLAARLSVRQLRAVLLHEAVHLRRGDVWINFAQTLLQIAYWWHPLLWLANARIRRVREEAVDDAVMLTLREGADAYAPTLLEVAKFAFHRPLASLGLVGILESRSALRQRVERLMDFRPPQKAGITLLSLFGIFAFSAVALPMGQGPLVGEPSVPSVEDATNTANQNTSTVVYFLQKPVRERDLQQLLQQAGVKTPPTIYIYLKGGRLLARGTDDQLDDIRRVVLKLNGYSSIHVRTNLSNVRVAVLQSLKAPPHSRLYSIHLGVSYKSRPLNEVLQDLTERSRELDPDNQGMRFVFQSRQSSSKGINPTTGLPENDTAVSGFADPTNIMISMTLSNASLADVSDAICSAAGHRISYSVRIDTVVFSREPQYEMRTFKVNPVTFYSNLTDNVAYDGPSKEIPRQISAMSMEFFSKLGVKFDPPKTVFFNEGHGVLFVYATPQDLDIIEKAVEALSGAPQQIHIKARFIEVPQKYLSSAGTASMFPGLTNGAIFPNAEFRHLLHEVESQEGTEELAVPEVTTIAGRQIQMRATTTQPVITGYTLRDASAPAVAGSVQPYEKFPDGSSIVPTIEQVETGPVLDVVPNILSDGYTIHLRTIPSLVSFLGYASPNGFASTYATNTLGKRIKLPPVLPRFHVTEASADNLLWDGQTLVLAPPVKEMLGDRFVQDNSNAGKKEGDKELLVFVTATMIDAAGNRVHTAAELPFAQTNVPPQLP